MPVQQPGEYKLLECKIMSSTGTVARLEDKVIGIQIYENMFSQSILANLTIVDNTNLVMKMPIIGQEFVALKIESPEIGEINFSDNVFAIPQAIERSFATPIIRPFLPFIIDIVFSLN